ncbi:hypothetical protein HH310_02415 [Actinoplanes sp. TBRC 11911]|uniref:hypothetical protein n=1 Tax=Actinoplanes sp. TBRC 11911 TaxID=2729386 RepID=UPI00145D2D88|nr:hypothetical protein [Actinoplanes sp. TBRC 11911]NMO50050.1 hypothetical protein [Actinoplanes sp. TBRC 11911]
MHSLVLPLVAAVGLGVAPAPATADSFRLVAGGVVGHGTYQRNPIRIAGTLTGKGPSRCAAIQVARSGPADGIEWHTFGRHCGRGRTRFRVEASYLFRGVYPPVRLCAGRTIHQAERGRSCDRYQPPVDRSE